MVVKLPKPNSSSKQQFDFSIYCPFNNLTDNGRKVLSRIVAKTLKEIFGVISSQSDDASKFEIHKSQNDHYTLRTRGLPFAIIEQILNEDSTKDKVLAAISDNTKSYSNLK